MTPTQFDTIQKVRAIFPNELYLGGSAALKKFFFNTELIKPQDLDFFIYIDRLMEKSVMNFLLKHYFIVLKSGCSYDGKYLIPGQYWRYKCKDFNGIEFDLIFIRPAYISNCMGSTLAGIQYKINYSQEVISKPSNSYMIECMKKASVLRIVDAYREQNTPEQLEKVKERCRLLGLELRIH